MKIAIVGCGYVAEYYAATLANHPQLELAGAFDLLPDRATAFSRRNHCRAYSSMAELLADSEVSVVVNLTNPRSHRDINRAALESGKHVYSEKPIAMTADDARELAELAASRGLHLAAAPCSVLSETAQTLWKAVRDGMIGRVRIAYATFDDGMIAPHMAPWSWKNDSGVPWPAKDEFEVGCTYQHAGYVLTWLTAMFGPAVRMSSFASCQIPDKGIPVDRMAPDFTVGGIEYASGVVARVTCGLVAPRDKSIMVVGDEGVLWVTNVRDDAAPVFLRRPGGSTFSRVTSRVRPLRKWLSERLPPATLELLESRKVPMLRPREGRVALAEKPVDFCRGIADLVDAVATGRAPRLSAGLAAHTLEIVERLQYPERFTDDRLRSTCDAMAPMPWAQ